MEPEPNWAAPAPQNCLNAAISKQKSVGSFPTVQACELEIINQSGRYARQLHRSQFTRAAGGQLAGSPAWAGL